jgi:hypothetical protein
MCCDLHLELVVLAFKEVVSRPVESAKTELSKTDIIIVEEEKKCDIVYLPKVDVEEAAVAVADCAVVSNSETTSVEVLCLLLCCWFSFCLSFLRTLQSLKVSLFVILSYFLLLLPLMLLQLLRLLRLLLLLPLLLLSLLLLLLLLTSLFRMLEGTTRKPDLCLKSHLQMLVVSSAL